MSDGATLVGELDGLVARLDTASKELYKLQTEFDDVEENYEDAFNDLLFDLIDEYEDGAKKDQRLPGEDARKAIVIKRFRQEEPILFGQYRRLRKELARKEKLAKSIERSISAKQSSLSYEKTQAQATQ